MEERFRNLDYQNWKPVRTLGTDSYGTVYEIARDDGFGMVDHAALKVLSIPAAPEDFDALVAEGRTPEEVTALLHRQVETIARQLMAVDAISDEPNLLRCEDHVIRAHPDGRGWDIYVRTELLPSLPDYLRNHPHGEADIIQLGAGLCSALETCHRRGIVHGDIKPRNVFVGGGNFNEQVTYKLGDFGMAQFSAVDNTNDFMAPEVLCGAEVSPESDLYSVGMVLYWALNERRIPFVPLPPTAVEASDLAIAREQRLRGDPLPEPLHGSQALKNVVMRACADDPAQRYASVEEFRAALLAVARRAAAAQPQQAQAAGKRPPPRPSPRTHSPARNQRHSARPCRSSPRARKNRTMQRKPSPSCSARSSSWRSSCSSSSWRCRAESPVSTRSRSITNRPRSLRRTPSRSRPPCSTPAGRS